MPNIELRWILPDNFHTYPIPTKPILQWRAQNTTNAPVELAPWTTVEEVIVSKQEYLDA